MKIIFKRPVVSFCIMMILGILLSGLGDSLLLTAGVFLLTAAFFFASGILRKGVLFVPAGMLAFFLLGSLELTLADRLQNGRFGAFEGQTVTVCGQIASEPEFKGERINYIVKVDSVRAGYYGTPVKTGGKILLGSVKGKDGTFLDYGREVQFEGVLSLPKGVRNPGGFDYRRYLLQRGVGACIFSYPYAIEPGKGYHGNFLVQAGLAIRKRIIFVVENSLPPQQAGLLNGMLIGYRDGLSEEVQQAFSNAGLTHIMAVSGANVAFLILPLAFLLKWMKIPKRTTNLLIIAFLVLFVFITGFEPSVLRAVIMAIILLAARIVYREPDTYAAIALSSILILAANPCMLFHIGFQLSYAATLSIVMLQKNIKKLLSWRYMPGWVAEILAATLAAQIGVLPITLIHFNRVSVIAILPNLLAVPMLEIITILGTVMALVGQFSLVLSQWLGYPCDILLSAILLITKVSSSFSFSILKTVTPPVILAIFYYIAIWFLLWYKPMKNIRLKPYHAAAALTVVAAMALVFLLRPDSLEVVFLDVGEGDCAFIRTCEGKTILIDGGGSANPGKTSTIGKSVVVPFLLDSGVGRLDAVIATHPHSDHTQGLEGVLEQLRVTALILPSLQGEEKFGSLTGIAGRNGVQVQRCGSGDVLLLDEKTRFDVLGPEKECSVQADSFNNASLVLKLVYGKSEILFTGDSESEAEDELIVRGALLDSDVIKIAHHGSRTSTTKALLDGVTPQAAIISVGKNNFGHPAQETLELLAKENIPCFRTDECGAVIMQSDGHSIRIRKTVQ